MYKQNNGMRVADMLYKIEPRGCVTMGRVHICPVHDAPRGHGHIPDTWTHGHMRENTSTTIHGVAWVYDTQPTVRSMYNVHFFFFFCRTHLHVLFWDHWYPCFGFLVTSPLGFKARVGSALFALRRRM